MSACSRDGIQLNDNEDLKKSLYMKGDIEVKMKNMKTLNRGVCILGTTVFFLTACTGNEAVKDNPVDLNADIESSAAEATDDTDAGTDLNEVISGIEGVWATAHIPQDIRIFGKGTSGDGVEESYNAVIDPDTGDVKGYQAVGTRTISSVERTSDSTGEYYKIFMSEVDVVYYWYPDRPDDLEYHWGADGYSASDSLIRQTGASLDDYDIIESGTVGNGMYEQYYEFVSDPYKFAWDGVYYDRYVYDDLDYGWKDFALIDFDGDGSDELIATNEDWETRVDAGMQYYLIASYYDGKLVITELGDGVASAGGYRGTKCYLPGKGVIYDDAFSAPLGAPSFSIYRLQNGSFEYTEGGYVSPDFDLDYPECLDKGEWHVGDSIVTEEEYYKAFKELTDDNSGIALEDIEYIGKDEMLKELSSHQ